jgi:hypothetical protein
MLHEINQVFLLNRSTTVMEQFLMGGKGVMGISTTKAVIRSAQDVESSNDDALLGSTTPMPGETTLGLYQRLHSGFRNEAMAFQGFVMYGVENNFTQILLPSLFRKDLYYGSMRPIEHDKLFDVEHWNSFYPMLPRMVQYNETLFPDWDGKANRFHDKDAEMNATAPYAYGRYPRLMSRYRTHLKRVANGQANNTPAIRAMQKVPRPHPDASRHGICSKQHYATTATPNCCHSCVAVGRRRRHPHDPTNTGTWRCMPASNPTCRNMSPVVTTR